MPPSSSCTDCPYNLKSAILRGVKAHHVNHSNCRQSQETGEKGGLGRAVCRFYPLTDCLRNCLVLCRRDRPHRSVVEGFRASLGSHGLFGQSEVEGSCGGAAYSVACCSRFDTESLPACPVGQLIAWSLRISALRRTPRVLPSRARLPTGQARSHVPVLSTVCRGEGRTARSTASARSGT